MYGLVNFLKPAGMTSHDAVGFFRKITGIKKIGHTGTLDPMAVGVLPICIGKATRLIEFLEGDKKYRAVMKLGITSETGDIWGQKLEYVYRFVYPEISKIEACLKNFKGDIEQQVPAYSAQKHNGKKMYEYARAGEEVPVKKKHVYVNNITVKSCMPDQNEVMFDIACSKGTYIRTICTDAGKQLGVGGVMSFLLRTASAGLDIREAVTIEELEEELEYTGNIYKYLKDPGDFLTGMKQIVINHEEARKFADGLNIIKEVENDAVYAVFKSKNADDRELVGIGKAKNNSIKPQKVIFSEI